MSDVGDIEKAERIGRSRARLFTAQAVMFIAWQGMFFVNKVEEPLVRTVSIVRMSAWTLWVVALLLLIATGGGLMRSRGVRNLLNDELTQANRAASYKAGFWAAAAAAIFLHMLTMVEAVTAREAIHIILSAGIGAALLTFAARERRSQAG